MDSSQEPQLKDIMILYQIQATAPAFSAECKSNITYRFRKSFFSSDDDENQGEGSGFIRNNYHTSDGKDKFGEDLFVIFIRVIF